MSFSTIEQTLTNVSTVMTDPLKLLARVIIQELSRHRSLWHVRLPFQAQCPVIIRKVPNLSVWILKNVSSPVLQLQSGNQMVRKQNRKKRLNSAQLLTYFFFSDPPGLVRTMEKLWVHGMGTSWCSFWYITEIRDVTAEYYIRGWGACGFDFRDLLVPFLRSSEHTFYDCLLQVC